MLSIGLLLILASFVCALIGGINAPWYDKLIAAAVILVDVYLITGGVK